MSEKHLYIYKTIGNDPSREEFTLQELKEDLEKLKCKKGDLLKVHINSLGGDVTIALSIYKTLVELKKKVRIETINEGYCYSAAVIVMQAGHTRTSRSHGQFLLHNITGSHDFTIHNMKYLTNTLVHLHKEVINLLKLKTGITGIKLKRLLDKEAYLSSKKAKQINLVDNIDK